MVVVEGQSLAGGVGQFEHGIDGRIEPPGVDFRDDLLAGSAFEAEHVPVAGPVDPAVDDHGQRHRLRGCGASFGSFSRHSGSVSTANGHGVGEQVSLAHGQGIARRAVRSLTGLRRCPASIVSLSTGRLWPCQFHGGLLTGSAAQREDAGDEREFADGDAIHEIRPAAVDGVLDFDHVRPVRRDLEHEDRIGMEAVVVAKGQLPALGVVQRQRGLEPAGDGVGQVRDQFPSGGGDDQRLALPRLEAVAVRIAGRESAAETQGVRLARDDLPVDDGRQRDVRRGRGGEADRDVVVLNVGDQFRLLLAEFGQPAHAEAERVRHAAGRFQPHLPRTRLGVGADRDLQLDGFADGRVRLPPQLGGHVAGELAADLRHLPAGGEFLLVLRQLREPVAHRADIHLRHGFDAFDLPGFDAGAGEGDAADVVQDTGRPRVI